MFQMPELRIIHTLTNDADYPTNPGDLKYRVKNQRQRYNLKKNILKIQIYS